MRMLSRIGLAIMLVRRARTHPQKIARSPSKIGLLGEGAARLARGLIDRKPPPY
jgi:hypothetical protein